MADTYAEVKAIIIDLLGVDESRVVAEGVSVKTLKRIRSISSS